MVPRHTKKLFFGTAAAIGLVTAAVMLSGYMTAEAQVGGKQVRGKSAPGRQGARGNVATQVGTYDAEAVFQAHPAQQQMQQAVERAQAQMQQAQQQGDQQQMQQIQQQFEQVRGQAVQQFRQDITRVMPRVAQAVGVQVVAMDIVYKAEQVETVDLTRSLTQALADLHNQPAKPQAKPEFQIQGPKE